MRGQQKHLVAFGEHHTDHLVSETLEHYHEERPRQSLRNEPQVNLQTTETPISDIDETTLRIFRRERPGGRLKHYGSEGDVKSAVEAHRGSVEAEYSGTDNPRCVSSARSLKSNSRG